MNNKTEKQISRTTKIFIICMVISPIVSLYSFHGVSLATILMVLSYLLYILIVDRRLIIYNIFGAILMAYIVINAFFCVLSLSEGSVLSILLRTIQYFVLLFIPLTLDPHLFDYRRAKRIYIRCAFVVSGFLIIQYLFVNFAGVYISGIIQNPLFPPNESILEITSNTISTGRRVSGVFSEPAAHGVYAIGALVLALFDEELNKRFLVIFVIGLSILMCVSSTGILTMLFVVVIYVLFKVFSNNRYIDKRFFLILPITIFAIALIQKTSFWNLFLFRMNEGTSGNNRTAAYSIIFSENFTEVLFGHGMNLTSLVGKVYYSGYPRYIYYFGLFGLVLWLGMILKYVRNAKREIKVLVFTLLFLNIGESTMIGFAGCLILLFVCMGKTVNDVRDNEEMIV